MDFFGFLRDFFIPSRTINPPNENPRSQFLKTETENPPERIPSYGTEQFTPNDDPVGFNVFSNPLEMHRYFEKQMNDMLKTFGFQNDDSFFGFFDGNSIAKPFNGYVDESQQTPFSDNETNLRDQFLKPGFQEPKDDIKERSDTDLDGQIQPNDLDSMFKEKNKITPYQPQSHFRSFGQSITSKTIRNSDGSIETHRTVKDSQGNQETVVTRKWGDKEYSVTTKTDKDGKQVVMENLKNLDEGDLQKFLKGGDKPEVPVVPKTPHNWFPFDKYFRE